MNKVLGFLKAVPWQVWVIIVAFGVIMGVRGHINDLNAQIDRLRIEKDSVEAVADTTRLVEVAALEDSLDLYQRRIVQTEQERDELDLELRQERAFRASLSVKVDSLTSELSAPVTEAADTLKMHFEQDTVPYSLEADVVVPPVDPVTLTRADAFARFTVRIAPIPLEARIGCSPNVDDTFNQATLNITAPEWANIQIGEVQQEPRVCNPDLTVLDTRSFYEKPLFVALGTASVIAISLIVF